MDPTPDISAPALFDLHGKNVLITGATRGIGAASAVALAEAGANICLVQRPPAPDSVESTDTFDKIKSLGVSATIVHCDLGDLDQVRSLFPRALEAMGGNIHILVNCAGIQRRHPAVAFPESDWDEASIITYVQLHLQLIACTCRLSMSTSRCAGSLLRLLVNTWYPFDAARSSICALFLLSRVALLSRHMPLLKAPLDKLPSHLPTNGVSTTSRSTVSALDTLQLICKYSHKFFFSQVVSLASSSLSFFRLPFFSLIVIICGLW